MSFIDSDWSNHKSAPQFPTLLWFPTAIKAVITEGKNRALVGAILFCGEYPGPRFEDKFGSANQMDGMSKVGGDKMAAS